jgi:hypothetical protein
MKEDNTVFVLQKAIKIHRLKVTKDTIKEFLFSPIPGILHLKAYVTG